MKYQERGILCPKKLSRGNKVVLVDLFLIGEGGAGFEVLKSFPESTYHFSFKTFPRNIYLLMRKA